MECKKLIDKPELRMIAWKDTMKMASHIHVTVPDAVIVNGELFGFSGIDFTTEGQLSEKLMDMAAVVHRIEENQRDHLARIKASCPDCKGSLYSSPLPDHVKTPEMDGKRNLIQCRACGYRRYE